MSRAKIFQNKEKGTTTVVFENTNGDAYNYINKRTKHYHSQTVDLYMPFRIAATTRLSQGDEWNGLVGEREAFHKADVKHHNALKRCIKEFHRDMIQDCLRVDDCLFEEVLKEFGYRKEK